jgi:hypothetical protein
MKANVTVKVMDAVNFSKSHYHGCHNQHGSRKFAILQMHVGPRQVAVKLKMIRVSCQQHTTSSSAVMRVTFSTLFYLQQTSISQ